MLIFGLDEVDPLHGEYPRVVEAETPGLARRMRKLLAGRTREDLDRFITYVNEMLSSKELHAAVAAEIELLCVEEKDGVEPSGDGFTIRETEARPLVWCLQYFELDDADWSQIFACFALALLNEAALTEKDLSRFTDDPGTSWRVLWNVAPWTSAAIEAGAYAEALAMGMPASSPFTGVNPEKRITIRRRINGKKRHAKTDQVIRALANFYTDGNYTTYASAVRAFCDANPDLITATNLVENNRERTLREGLSNQLKGRR